MKSKAFFLFFGFLILSFLGGCTFVSPKTNLPETYRFRDHTKYGVVVYSQVTDHATSRVFVEDATLLKDSLNYSEYIAHPLGSPMIDKPEYQGILTYIALPVGDYMINRWHYQKGGKMKVHTGWNTEFHVEPKTITYLGRFNIHADDQVTWVDVEDQFEEDIGQFRQGVPKLAEVEVTKLLGPSVSRDSAVKAAKDQ